jgi:hypothetical protein
VAALDGDALEEDEEEEKEQRLAETSKLRTKLMRTKSSPSPGGLGLSASAVGQEQQPEQATQKQTPPQAGLVEAKKTGKLASRVNRLMMLNAISGQIGPNAAELAAEAANELADHAGEVLDEQIDEIVNISDKSGDGGSSMALVEARNATASTEGSAFTEFLFSSMGFFTTLSDQLGTKMKIFMTYMQVLDVFVLTYKFNVNLPSPFPTEIISTLLLILSGGFSWVYNLLPFLEPSGCADATNDSFLMQFHFAVSYIVLGSTAFMFASMLGGCCRNAWNSACLRVWGLLHFLTYTNSCTWVFTGLEPAVLIDDDHYVLRSDVGIRCESRWGLSFSATAYPACDEVRHLCLMYFFAYLCALPVFIYLIVWRYKGLIYCFPVEEDAGLHGIFVGSDENGDGVRTINRTMSGITLLLEPTESCKVAVTDGPYTLVEIAEDEEGGTVFLFSGGLDMTALPDENDASANANTAWGWMAADYNDGAWYYESLEFVRRLVLCCLVTLMEKDNPIMTLAVCLMISILYLGFANFMQPFKDAEDDMLNGLSYLFLSLILGNVIALKAAGLDDEVGSREWLSLCCIIPTALMIMFVLYEVSQVMYNSTHGICAVCGHLCCGSSKTSSSALFHQNDVSRTLYVKDGTTVVFVDASGLRSLFKPDWSEKKPWPTDDNAEKGGDQGGAVKCEVVQVDGDDEEVHLLDSFGRESAFFNPKVADTEEITAQSLQEFVGVIDMVDIKDEKNSDSDSDSSEGSDNGSDNGSDSDSTKAIPSPAQAGDPRPAWGLRSVSLKMKAGSVMPEP